VFPPSEEVRANHHVAQHILAERKVLGDRPFPCERTIERVLERNGLTAPRVPLAPLLPRQQWPGPQARAANELHEVDLVGLIYLQGRSQRYYIWTPAQRRRGLRLRGLPGCLPPFLPAPRGWQAANGLPENDLTGQPATLPPAPAPTRRSLSPNCWKVFRLMD
jgi:hypothetical protein